MGLEEEEDGKENQMRRKGEKGRRATGKEWIGGGQEGQNGEQDGEEEEGEEGITNEKE